jgi:ribosomal protein L4
MEKYRGYYIDGKKTRQKETKVVVNFFEKENLPRSITFEFTLKKEFALRMKVASMKKQKLKSLI